MLPVLATGIGAIPERLQGRPLTWLVEFDEASPETFVDWLERLQRDCLTTSPRWLRVNHLPALTRNFYEQEYFYFSWRAETDARTRPGSKTVHCRGGLGIYMSPCIRKCKKFLPTLGLVSLDS